MRRSLGAASVLLLAAGSLAACAPRDVHLSVSPGTSTYDVPLAVRVDGLHGGEHVTLRLTETDRRRVDWRSTVEATADGQGRLRTTDVRLVSRLAAASGRPAYFSPMGAWVEHISVLDGDHELARGGATRHDPAQDLLTRRARLSVPRDGLYGEIYRPRKDGPATSAVVTFGGSEGGLATQAVAGALAAHGHPALALAYFGAPGLPKNLEDVPLEYFARAVRRLRQVPGVDPNRIFLFGDSRGSEAALLTAIHFPRLVHGVVAGVPNAITGESLPTGRGAAWSLHGRPLPTSRVETEAPDEPRARIDPGSFPGPVLLVCGGLDEIWSSCPQAAALKRRDPRRTTLLDYPDAGHLVGSILPGLANTFAANRFPDGRTERFGGTPQADQLGHFDAWPRLLAFLDR